METRPKINIKPTALDRKLKSGGLVLMIVLWSLTVYAFFQLPPTVPIHYNASGHADDYGNKTTFLFLPILATVIYAGLSQLSNYSHVFNYMTQITAENAERQYGIASRMLKVVGLAVLVVFITIILFTYLTAVGIAHGIGSWVLPLTFGLFLIPTIISIAKSLQTK